MSDATWWLAIVACLTIQSFADDRLLTPVPLSTTLDRSEAPEIESSNAVHRTRSLPQPLDAYEDDDSDIDSGNWTTISEMLDLYNSRNLVIRWKEGRYNVEKQCEKDITIFVEALTKHETWAIKADDASGRYTNGFLWGNSYFTGSATECSYIGTDYDNKRRKYPAKPSVVGNDPAISMSEPQEFNSKTTRRVNRGVDLPSRSLPSGARLNEIPPPYKLGFVMFKIAINATPSLTTRLIHLGVCLPFSCAAADAGVVVRLAASQTAAQNSVILKIRDQHNYYDIYDDSVFWALMGSSVIVALLMLVGTSYDYFLSMKHNSEKRWSCDSEKQAKFEQSPNSPDKLANVSEGKVYLPVPVADATIAVTPVLSAPTNININNNNSSSCNNNNNREKNDAEEGSTGAVSHVSGKTDGRNLSVLEELLLSFSIRANMKTICDPGVGRDTIGTVHGLRAISMAWVILGHTCIVMFNYSDNMEYRKIVEKKFLFQTVTNGAFSVDTFFFMGGLLVSFLYFRTNAMGDLNKLTQGTRGFAAGCLKFLGFLAYRFCRLTAPYMFILGVVEVTMKWFNSNSVFEPPTADHENCPNYWWRNLLYINTLFPVDQMCMLWSWYVADDTQFYVIGAVVLIVATNHIKLATFSVVTLLLSSWLTTGYIALINNHMPSSDDPLALFDKIYDKPWTRLGPYLIGMTVGYYLFKTECKVKMSKTVVVVGWLLSSACLLSLLYGLYEAELSPVTAAAYSSLSHSAWALGLSWIVVACSTGYGGWVNDILSAPILYPFSRVTYCAYLVHPIVIRLTAMNLDSPFHLGKDTIVISFFGQVVLSYVLSFVVSISFEAPVVSMLKILSPKKRKRIQ